MRLMDVRDTQETMLESRERGMTRIALLIAVLAAMLAIVEMGGGNAEQEVLKSNVDAANLWAFFQAKTMRQTTLRTEADRLEVDIIEMSPQRAEAARKLLASWRATIDRYESEPATNEGRKELAARAKTAEAERDRALAADNLFDLGSAALQLAIVLASASIVANIAWLAWLGSGIGLVGVAFALLGWFAPTLISL